MGLAKDSRTLSPQSFTFPSCPTRSFSLVLGGGGLKGLAHIGALQALEEAGLRPSGVVGSSIGSLIAAAWAAGRSVDYMRERALRLRRKDVFQVAHTDMAFKRMQSPAVYRHEPLDHLIHELVGDKTFDELQHPLIVNTVDINSGMQVLWGLPGLRYVPVADAVFASCALPGILPPREISGRWYVDGAVADNLPVKAATVCGPGPIVAVDVSASMALRSEVEKSGFATTYARGLEIVMQTMLERTLRLWRTPPAPAGASAGRGLPDVRLRPDAGADGGGVPGHAAAGARAAAAAGGARRRGSSRRRPSGSTWTGARCIGCGACALRAPGIFQMDALGKAEVVAPRQAWSPLDGIYIRNCPTWAISARPVTGEWSGPLPVAATRPSAGPPEGGQTTR